ncbi:MAG: ATP-binding cassette domain-containing protein [Verrucomicrobiota bacterium]
MIHVEALRFRYPQGDFQLSLDRLSLAAGQQATLTGPSGSGKSTLIQLLSGILLPESGRIEVAGQEMTGLEETARRQWRVRRLGFVFQDFGLLPHLRILDNILLPFHVHRALRLSPEIRARAGQLAETTGLTPYLSRLPEALSHGERQRAAICRALLTRPALVLADEPTGNLDHATAQLVLDLMQRECREIGATLLCVTHDPAVTERFSQHFHLPRLLAA